MANYGGSHRFAIGGNSAGLTGFPSTLQGPVTPQPSAKLFLFNRKPTKTKPGLDILRIHLIVKDHPAIRYRFTAAIQPILLSAREWQKLFHVLFND
jgi:hypothetical protein